MILVVEDDRGIREAIVSLLNVKGHEAMPIFGRQEAIYKLDQIAVDLVLLDLDMPHEDGWRILEALNFKRPMLPVIALTAFSNPKYAIVARNDFHVLEKPFEPAYLLKLIESIMPQSLEKRMTAPNSKVQSFDDRDFVHRDSH